MENSLDNIQKYPYNIFEPKILKFNADNGEYTEKILYRASFDGIFELYNFLKSNPAINTNVFNPNNLSSQRNGSSKYHEHSYEETLESLIKEDDRYIDLFLELSDVYEYAKDGLSEEYRTIYKTSGGRLNNILYATGAPKCYEIKQKVIEPKFITVHVNLLISGDSSDEIIYNRAFILLNILSALEKQGYSIDLDTFVETKSTNEIIQVFINLKDYRSQLNIDDLIKLTFNKDFFRRIIFRVMESMPVKSKSWSQYYGSPSNMLIEVNEDELYFSDPRSMGIKGENLYDDFVTVVDNLNLRHIFDIESLKEDFSSSKLTLKMK